MTSETGGEPKAKVEPLPLGAQAAIRAHCQVHPSLGYIAPRASSLRERLAQRQRVQCGCSVGALRFDRRFILACMEHSLVSEGRKVKSI